MGLLKKLEKNPKFLKDMMQLYEDWSVKSHVLKQLPDVRTKSREFDRCCPCQTPAQDGGAG